MEDYDVLKWVQVFYNTPHTETIETKAREYKATLLKGSLSTTRGRLGKLYIRGPRKLILQFNRDCLTLVEYLTSGPFVIAKDEKEKIFNRIEVATENFTGE